MDKYPKNLSKRRTLYDEIIRLYEENKKMIISDRKILVMDRHFEGITGVTRSVLSSIKKENPDLSYVRSPHSVFL